MNMDLPRFLSRVLPGDISRNPPLLSLIVANLITIVMAVIEGWDLATVLFIYWAQSVIIGIFAFVSLLSADTETLAAEMGKAQADAGGSPHVSGRFVWFYKVLLAGFFALHYGLFHWGYLSFLIEPVIFGPVDFSGWGVWLSCGLFLANHLYSYLYHRGGGPKGADFVTGQFIGPYNRIIPMHLTIIFGSVIILVLEALGIPGTLPVLVLFLLIKTRQDIALHLRKHYEDLHPDEPKMYIGF